MKYKIITIIGAQDGLGIKYLRGFGLITKAISKIYEKTGPG
jgi:hypothetical protein